jgi:poly-beta-1,6-N-acetyl-D-glucosamine synthase
MHNLHANADASCDNMSTCESRLPSFGHAGSIESLEMREDNLVSLPPYALITPARNEEQLIEKTILSMVNQTVLPAKWVIVDDGSTDRTPEIVASYAERYPWIELVRRSPRKDRNFAGKVHAFREGLEQVKHLQVEFIGNLDADISFGPDHFEFLLNRLVEDPLLGVTGTAYTEGDWDSTRDSFEGQTSVHGACQLFRLTCYQDIGGYQPSRKGGIDWMAVTTARMKGWKTRNYLERRFRHHRLMGTAERSTLEANFDYGKKDYLLGGSPLWELFRGVYRMTKKPRFLAGLALLLGYCSAAVQRVERPVSAELMRFHRQEQMTKLREILSSLIRFRKVDNYLVGTPTETKSTVK